MRADLMLGDVVGGGVATTLGCGDDAPAKPAVGEEVLVVYARGSSEHRDDALLAGTLVVLPRTQPQLLASEQLSEAELSERLRAVPRAGRAAPAPVLRGHETGARGRGGVRRFSASSVQVRSWSV